MKHKRVFREWQHPRDDRGRFSRSGGGSWAKRAAAGFAKAEEGRVAPPSAPGRPRIGRNAKAGLILNQHQPGAGDALSRKWTPPEKLPPGADRRRAIDLAVGERRQVLHEGVWRTVVGTGWGGGTDHIMVELDNGERIKLPDDGTGFISRPYQVEIHEPLRGGQIEQMAAWRADATRPPAMHVPTNREDSVERYRKELAVAQANLKEAQRKARARANRKYPNKEGYGKWTRDQYVDSETWKEQSEATWAERYLKDALTPSDNPKTEAYLNEPSHRLPVVAGELNRDRPLAVYGNLLVIEDEDQATYRHLRDLATLPAELHAIVARVMAAVHTRDENTKRKYPDMDARGGRAGVYVGSRPVHELNHSDDLKDDPAKLEPSTDGSYKDTRKWSEVAGVYRGNQAIMIAGVSGPRSKGEVALHEFGHALDDSVGRLLQETGDMPIQVNGWASTDPEWRELWRQTVAAGPNMNPYFSQQGEDVGAKEMWAEAFAEWARARARARQSSIYADASEEGRRDYLAGRGGAALQREFRIPREGGAAAEALNAYFERLVAKLGVDL